MVRSIFGRESADMLSGYKGFSRRFVKSFPAMSSGFETETELTVHALELRMPIGPKRRLLQGATLRDDEGSLRTYRDRRENLPADSAPLVKDERPFRFFGLMGLMVLIFGAVLAVPIFQTYFETRPRPSASDRRVVRQPHDPWLLQHLCGADPRR